MPEAIDKVFTIFVFGFLYTTLISSLITSSWLAFKLKDDKTAYYATLVIVGVSLELIIFLSFGFIEWLNWPNQGGEMHKFNVNDIRSFTNKSITGIKDSDGKKCRITELVPDDNNEYPIYFIEFLDEVKGFGARENELSFLYKAIFPRLCPRCEGNIDTSDNNPELGKIRCPHCFFEIRRLT